MRVVITGGGTGGHIYPGLAVAEALRLIDAAVEIRFIGGSGAMESRIVPEAGLPFIGVASRKLRKLASPDTALVLLMLMRGYREAAAHLRTFRPEVLVSTGGYVAAATALAAARQRIPCVIQEYNAVPGRTNRWLSRWAARICVWLDETAAALPGAATARTGVPLREGVISAVSREEARAGLGLDKSRFTVLVLGGSQGARRLNELVLESAGSLPEGVQVLHQTGPNNLEAVLHAANERGLSAPAYLPRPYLNEAELPMAYRAADLLICRCGISTLAEATANGVPMLMVPLPTAQADHQSANARAMERAGAGIHLPEPELTEESLTAQVKALAADSNRLNAMGESGRQIAKPDAARLVAQIAMECAGRVIG